MLVVLSLANPAAAANGRDGFPLPSLPDLAGWLRSPQWGLLPQQGGGSADGRAHTVPASATRAGGGAGHRPGTGAGELAPYAPFQPQAKQGPSGASTGGTFDAKTSTMDGRKSSAMVTWYANKDGSFTRTVAQRPVNYESAPGVWSPIDTTLVRDSAGRLGEKANSTGVSLAPHAAPAGGDLVRVSTSDGKAVGYSLRGAADVPGSVSGNTVTYRGVLPGVSISVVAGPTGEKESLVLASPSAGSSWTFALHTEGLTPSLDGEGALVLSDASGQQVGRIPLAYAYDSNVNPVSGDPATTWKVSYGLSATADGWALTLSVDPAWLSDPARVYPVTVDPTLILSTTGSVSTTYTTTDGAGDYSSDTRIKTGDCIASQCGSDTKAIGLMTFPSFPTGQGYYATSASLHMFDTWTAVSVGTPNCNTSHSVTWPTVYVAPVTQGWSVTGAKAYPGPSYGPVMGSSAPVTWNACTNTGGSLSTGDWVSIPLTDLTYINGWSFNTQPNYGVAVYGASGTLSWRKYDSDVEAGNSPYIAVTYSDQAPQVNSQYPPNGYSAPTLNPELLASASRPANSTTTGALSYDFTVYDASNTSVADSGWISSGDWVVPAGKLKWGTTYYWTVSASDGTLASVPRPLEALTVAVPQPVITSSLSQSGDNHGLDEMSGNYTTSTTDADVATVGPKLQVVRDYNSRDPRTTGAFGAAWSSVFDARATEQYNASGAVASVLVTYPDGSEVGFGRNSDGSFSPPSGRFATLRSVSGGYSLTDKNDTVYTFTQSLGSGGYGITSVADANARAVAFTWSGSQITTMSSAVSGRTLHLGWVTPPGAGSAHVSTVSTDAVTAGNAGSALVWKYFYSGDRLSEVCDPLQSGSCSGGSADMATRYGYVAASLYSTAVMDAGPHSYWRLAETSGTTAASSVIANEGTDNATYTNVSLGQPGALPGSPAGAAGFNGSSSYVTLPANLVSDASYQSVSMWFKTSVGNEALFSYQTDPISSPQTGSYTPALYVGSDGRLFGEFWYSAGVAPVVTSGSVADGRWHHVVLAAAGTSQTMYLDGAKVGSVSGQIRLLDLTGAQHEYVGAGFLGDGWPDESHFNGVGYATYFNGSISDVAFFNQTLSATAVGQMFAAGHSGGQLLSSVTRPSGKAYATVAYDPATARVGSLTDENGGTWTLNTPVVTGTSDAYRAAVLGSGPAGYYRLGDTAGAGQAYSEVNYGAGVYSNVTLGVAGPFADRTAASFNGSSSYLQLPATDQVSTGPNSVELWFNMAKGNTGGGVLFDEMGMSLTSSNPEAQGWDPALYVGTDGRLHAEFWMGNPGKTIMSPGLVNDGAWHHVVLSASTNSQTLYLDGNAVGTLAGTLTATALGNIYVGAGEADGNWPFHPTNTLGYFPGSIAELAFYRSQLSASDVTSHYAAYKSGVSAVSPTQVNTVLDPGGKTLTSKYDVLNGYRLISKTDGTGATTTYGYDTLGFLHTVTDANGNVTTTGHDVRGNTVSQTTCQNQAAQQCSTEYFTYWPDDTTAQLNSADPRNDLTVSFRDGRSSSATDNTYLTTYNYDNAGDRTSITTAPVPGFPNGRTSTVTYSDGTAAFPAVDTGNVPAGLPLMSVTPGGAVSRVAYFHNGDVASTTDADGLVTLYSYDGVGRVLSRTAMPGKPVGWWQLNQTSGTTVPDASGTGNAASAANVTWSGGVGVFNGTNSQIVSNNPVINTGASYTVSMWTMLPSLPSGFAVAMAVEGTTGVAAELTYDPTNKQWKYQTRAADVTAPQGTIIWSGTPAATGSWTHLVAMYDASSRGMTLYVNGALVGTTTVAGVWPASKSLSIGSTVGGNYFPGSIANVQVYQRALGASEVSTLYAAGYAGSTYANTTPGGLVTSMTYDAMGQVVSQSDPTVTNRVTGAAHTATTSTSFDVDGDITAQTVSDSTAGGDASRTVSSTFNAYDQRVTSTDANGHVTAMSYDAYGNLASQTAADGNLTTFSYDADGRPLTQQLQNYTGDPVNPSGARTLTESSRAYDPAGRLASITDAMGNTTSYTYTDNGYVATVTKTDPNGNNPYLVQSVTYDAAGNTISKVTNNGATTTTSTVDAADRTMVLQLDPNGVDRKTTMSYTPDDKLATSTETDTGGWQRTATYTYDPMGNQLSQALNLDGAGHPVGWWKLTQAGPGTTVTDASGTGNTANATNVTWTGSSAQFTATAGQQIATNGPVVSTTAPYSVSAWVNLSTVGATTQTVASQDANTNYGFALQYNGTDGTWAFTHAATDTTGAATIRAHGGAKPTAGTWYHVVGTFNPSTSTMTLYVNGNPVATATDTAPFAATGALVLGRDKTGGTPADLLSGQVSNVQVYNRVLAASEVSGLYQAGQNGGSVASSNQVTASWTRDVRGLPVTMTDPDGNTTNYTYDEAGRLAVTVGPAISAETYGSGPAMVRPVTTAGYDAFGEQTQAQDPNGNITNTVYDAEGNKVSQTLPGYTPPGSSASISATTVWTYDKTGNVTSESDPLNNTTTRTYDQLGDLATISTPDGGVTHTTYDTNGDKLSVTDPTGAQTQATYDYLGRQITSTVLERYPSAQALTTTNSYQASATNPGGANLASVTSPDGVTVSYGYDASGQKTSMTDAAGNTTRYSYTFMGDPYITTYPDGTSTEVDYNTNALPTWVTHYDASGAVVSATGSTYDPAGNLLSKTDARRNTTTYTYDATGLLTQEVQPVTATSSMTTSFGYDAAGNRTRYTDGRGTNWYTTYNSWSRPQSQIEPPTAAYTSAADSTTTIAYDADGRPANQTAAGGSSQSFTYDVMGDLLTQQGTGASAATATRTFTYDKTGRMLSAATSNTGGSTSNATSESFTYDDRSDLLSAIGTAGATSLGYNGDAQLTSRSDAAGTATYIYDFAGRVQAATDPVTGTQLTYGYNKLQQVTSIGYGSNGDTRTFGYDSLHRVASDTLQTPAGATVASISYGYDPNGNLTSKSTSGFGASSAANTYTYDQANRLTSWNNGTNLVTYGYDAASNRTQAGASTYTYDARDQLTSDGTSTYTYTAAGVLASQVSGGVTTGYASDAYGQQTSVGTLGYTYDALGRVVSRSDASSNSTLALQYSGTANDVASDGGYLYSRDPAGNPLGVKAAGGGSGQLMMVDQHTDVVGTFAATGTGLAGSATYDPFGNLVGTATKTGNLGFQSEYTDPRSGQVNMAARWYNPTVGQFTSKDTVQQDPAAGSAAANPFAYIGDNPMAGTDPSGHCWICSVWHSATSAVSTAWNDTSSFVSNTWDEAYSYASDAWDSVSSFVDNDIIRPAQQVYNKYVAPVVHAVKHAVSSAAHRLRDEYHRAKTWATKQVKRVAQATRKAVHAAVHVVKTAAHQVAKAASTTANFVKHHAADIAAIAAGVVVFAGCEALVTAVTGGALSAPGVVACGAAAGAASGLVSQGVKCAQHSSKDACSASSFAVSGIVGGVGGAIGGGVAGEFGGTIADGLIGDGASTASRVGAGMLDSVVTGAVSGGVAGGTAGGLGYGLTCADNCSLSGLASAAGHGAVDGAIGGAALAAVGGIKTSKDVTGEDINPGCRNSFTPTTPVLMADDTTKPIKDVKIGDTVKANDPTTGKDTPEPVTQLHDNHDTDLTDLTVATTTGTTVIHTTQEHPFWNNTTGHWTLAGTLTPGTHLHSTNNQTITVLAVHNWTGLQDMRNLTIDTLHTYYVMAGTTPVLVHNINTPIGCGPGGEPIYDIPAGSSGGPGAGQRIPPGMLGDYNVGVNAEPGSTGPLCSYCRTNPATSIDHVEPRVNGGDLTDANTTPACTPCNSSKGARVAPVNPPANYTGPWPPPWWPSGMR